MDKNKLIYIIYAIVELFIFGLLLFVIQPKFYITLIYMIVASIVTELLKRKLGINKYLENNKSLNIIIILLIVTLIAIVLFVFITLYSSMK